VAGGFGVAGRVIANSGMAEFGGFLIVGTFNSTTGGVVHEVDPQQQPDGVAIPTMSPVGVVAFILLVAAIAVGVLRRV
jgi:hypothetical protein